MALLGTLSRFPGLGVSLLLACVVGGAQAGDGTGVDERLVVLVRHAEKCPDQGADPELSEAGRTRARALQTALADADIGAIIVTDLKRTQATAAPLAAARVLAPEVIATHPGGTAGHVTAVAAAVRAARAEVVLVVGHSNTVPAIISALGGPEVAPIGDDDYGNLYLLWLAPERVRLVQTRY